MAQEVYPLFFVCWKFSRYLVVDTYLLVVFVYIVYYRGVFDAWGGLRSFFCFNLGGRGFDLSWWYDSLGGGSWVLC